MNRFARLLLVTFGLSGWLGMAGAQPQDVEPGDMVRGGLQAIQLVDQNKTGELWDGASPTARKRVARASFVQQVATARAPLGAPQQRTWIAVTRHTLNDPDPEVGGQYVSVEYESRFANQAGTTLREMVSFHLDADRVWRFSGYVLR